MTLQDPVEFARKLENFATSILKAPPATQAYVFSLHPVGAKHFQKWCGDLAAGRVARTTPEMMEWLVAIENAPPF